MPVPDSIVKLCETFELHIKVGGFTKAPSRRLTGLRFVSE